MTKKLLQISFILSIVVFILELIFGSLALTMESSAPYIAIFIFVAVLSIAWGSYLQYLGAKFEHSHSYIISTGFGFQVPLLQPMAMYFIYKFVSNK